MIELISEDSQCFHCHKEVRLNHAERVARKFVCPTCKQTSPALHPSETRCSGCRRALKLDLQESVTGRFTCPYCKVHNVAVGASTEPNVELPAGALVGPVPPRHDPKDDIVVGSVAIGVGVLVTVVSLIAGSGSFVVFFGPVVYGGFRLARGLSNRPRVTAG